MTQTFANIGTTLNAAIKNPTAMRRSLSRGKPLVGAYVSLLLFMVVYCARPEDWIPGLSVIPLAKITATLALLGLVFSLWQVGFSLPREVVYLTLLVGQLLLAAAMSPLWRGGAVQLTLDFAKVLVIVIVMSLTVSTAKRLRRLIFVQAASVSMIAAVAVWKGHTLHGRLEGVLAGNYADPNDLALAIIISLPLAFFLLFLVKNPLWKAVWALAMLVMLYAVLLTASRGGFIALIVTATIFLWEFAIRGRRRYLLVFAVLGGLILLQTSGGTLVGRLKGTFNIQENTAAAYGSAQAREQLFWRSLIVTMEHPLFGVGPGNFEQISGSWHVTHNSFTEMSAEGGVPALILYTLILWTGFKNLRGIKRLAHGQRESSLLVRALFASLAGYVVGSFFLSVAYEFFPYILVAYTTALLQIAKKSASRSKESRSESQHKPEIRTFATVSGHIGLAGWAR